MIYVGVTLVPYLFFRSFDQRVFALTEEKNGLFSSMDNGRRWKQVSLPDNLLLYDLTTDWNGQLILSTDKGVYSSGDNGKTWRQTDTKAVAFLSFSRENNDYLVKI